MKRKRVIAGTNTLAAPASSSSSFGSFPFAGTGLSLSLSRYSKFATNKLGLRRVRIRIPSNRQSGSFDTFNTHNYFVQSPFYRVAKHPDHLVLRLVQWAVNTLYISLMHFVRNTNEFEYQFKCKSTRSKSSKPS